MDLLRDFAYAKATGAIPAGNANDVVVVPVDDVSRLPSNAELAASDFWMTLESDLATGAFEIVRVLSHTSTAVTILRGQDGTLAYAHPANTYLKASITANMLRRISMYRRYVDLGNVALHGTAGAASTMTLVSFLTANGAGHAAVSSALTKLTKVQGAASAFASAAATLSKITYQPLTNVSDSVTDNFDRFTDGTTLAGQTTQTGGKTWTLPTGFTAAAKIVGGRVVPSVNNQGPGLLVSVGSTVQTVSFDFIVGNDTGNRTGNVWLCAQSNLSSYYDFNYSASGFGGIYNRGTGTLLASYSPAASPAGTVLTLSLSHDAAGNLTAKVNGATVLTATDSTLTGTNAGFAMSGVTTSTPNAIDNFTMAPAAPSTTTGKATVAGTLGKLLSLTNVNGGITDNFDRFADGTTLAGQTTQTGGKTWAIPTGTGGTGGGKVVGGKVVPIINTDGATGMFDVGTTVQTLSYDFIVGTDASNGTGSIFLCSGANGYNGARYDFGYMARDGFAYLYRRGTNTSLASYSFTAVGSGTVINLSMSHDAVGNIVCKANGVTIMTATDTTLTGTYAGFNVGGSSTGTPNAGDNFVMPPATPSSTSAKATVAGAMGVKRGVASTSTGRATVAAPLGLKRSLASTPAGSGSASGALTASGGAAGPPATLVQNSSVATNSPTFPAATTAGNSIALLVSNNAVTSPPASYTTVYDSGVDTNTGWRTYVFLRTGAPSTTTVTTSLGGSPAVVAVELAGSVTLAVSGSTASTSSTSTSKTISDAGTKAAPTVAATVQASTSSASSLTLTLASAPAVGSVLYAGFNISQFQEARDLTLPSGWTVIDTVLNSDVRTVTISATVGSGGVAAATSYTFNFTGAAQTHSGVLAVLTGATSTVAAHAATSAAQSTSVTAPAANDRPLALFTQNNGTGNGNTTNSVATAGWTTDQNVAPGFHATILGHGPATTASASVAPTPTWGGTVGNPGAAIDIIQGATGPGVLAFVFAQAGNSGTLVTPTGYTSLGSTGVPPRGFYYKTEAGIPFTVAVSDGNTFMFESVVGFRGA